MSACRFLAHTASHCVRMPPPAGLHRNSAAIADPHTSEAHLSSALLLLHAMLRALFSRPLGDPTVGAAAFLTPGGLEDVGSFLTRLLRGACACMQRDHTPVVKAGAVALLLYLASAHSNINQNALLDYAMLHADDDDGDGRSSGAGRPAAQRKPAKPALNPLAELAQLDSPSVGEVANGGGRSAAAGVPSPVATVPGLFRALVTLLRERSVRRTAGHDALLLLALLLSYNRFDRRNPFVSCMHALHTGNAVDEALSVDTRGSTPTSVDSECVRGMVESLAALCAACNTRLAQLAAASKRPSGAAALAAGAVGAAGSAAGLVARGVASTFTAAASLFGSTLWSSKPQRPRAVPHAASPGVVRRGGTTPPATPPAVPARSNGAGGGGEGGAQGERRHTPHRIRQAESPVTLDVADSVGVALVMFHEGFCSHPRGLAAAAGTARWRGHAGALPQPSELPELLRQLLSIVSFALQSASEGQSLAQLGLRVMLSITECRDDLLLLGRSEPASVSVSGLSGGGAGPHRNPVLTVLHSSGLNRLSTTFQVYRRGEAGVLEVGTSDPGRPVVAAVYRMVR